MIWARSSEVGTYETSEADNGNCFVAAKMRTLLRQININTANVAVQAREARVSS